MNDKMTRERVAEIVYEVIHERADQMIRERMAAIVAEVTHEQVAEIVAAARAKTLADMTDEERAACQWMQADVEQQGRAVIILPYGTGGRAVMLDQWGDVTREDHATVTPRPDLPRLEWPGNTHTPTPATLTVGSVWENAAALDEAVLESGRDQITVTDCDGDVYVWDANLHDWRDLHPIPNYAPFTILHTGRKAADAAD